MDRLLQDAAAERRRFLDRLVLAGDPDHAARSARYTYALRERGRLLREGRHDPAWLGALEARIAAAGTAIAAARRQTVAGLQHELGRDPGPFLRPTLALDGEVESWLEGAAALEVEERFAAALAAGRARDAESGTTSVGPHRGDLLVAEQATGCPAARTSTGQQKALLISIVLAEARRRAREGGRLPLLLLDEVAAHLDPTRREQLFDELARVGARAWLTGTDPSAFATLRGAAHFLSVVDSTLTPDD
jgi:DNA replication and repair protein RecF